jgi:hypothetical protein
VLAVLRGVGVHPLDAAAADDAFLHLLATFMSGFGGAGGLPGERQLDTGGPEDVVHGVQEVEHAGQADIGQRLVDELFELCRADTGFGQSGGGQHPEFGQATGRQDGGQLNKEAGVQVDAVVQVRGVGEDLVEGEVVEICDELGIGPGQRGVALAEKLVVVGLRGVADRHGSDLRCGVLLVVTGSSQVVASASPAASRIA